MRLSQFKLFFVLMFCVCTVVDAVSINRNYTYSYYEHGHPHTLGGSRRAVSEAYSEAFAEPNLIFQTGYYSVRFECDTLQLSGFDTVSGTDYLTALNEDITEFTRAIMLLVAYKGDKVFTSNKGVFQDYDNLKQHVRFVEGGQFVQRIDHTNIVLAAADGEELVGRLEFIAWPEHMSVTLDFSDNVDVTRTTVMIISPSGERLLSDEFINKTTLSLRPHEAKLQKTFDPAVVVSNLKNWKGEEMTSFWDEEHQVVGLNLTTEYFNNVARKETTHEYTFEVTNPHGEDQSIPLYFEPGFPRAVTGTTMLLCYEDGRPTGIPVQVSKNWHGSADNGRHHGQWLHGYTMIPLKAGESKTYRLKIVYGYWGNGSFAAVSHSSLSLIGWGDNTLWKWDQSALGAWGETVTYDPTQHAAGAFMGDMRPTFVTPMNESFTDHNWTENVGGCDLLNYIDSAGVYQPSKRVKTCYLWNGPNMTDVYYSGVTADEKIRYTYRVRGNGTLDYARKYNEYEYEFLEDVESPERLCFYQHGADFYFNSIYDGFFVGGHDGSLAYFPISVFGGNKYRDAKIPFDDKWMMIPDGMTYSDQPANCNRGILNHGATLNGETLPLFIHPYDRTWGERSAKLFDVASQTTADSYKRGDVVKGGFTYVLPAEDSTKYWGGDAEFKHRLNFKSGWQLMQDEYHQNEDLDIVVNDGKLRKKYPLEIEASADSVLVDFTITEGGIGHVPIVVSGVSAGRSLKAQRLVNDVWVDLESVTVAEHDYYQGFANSQGTIDYTFSIPRPSIDLNESWRVRVLGEVLDYESWKKSGLVYSDLPSADETVTSAEALNYVFGGSPSVVNLSIQPSLKSDEMGVYYEFTRPTRSLDEFAQCFEYSSDLQEWTEIELSTDLHPKVTIYPMEGGQEKVVVAMDGEEMKFGRFKINKI